MRRKKLGLLIAMFFGLMGPEKADSQSAQIRHRCELKVFLYIDRLLLALRCGWNGATSASARSVTRFPVLLFSPLSFWCTSYGRITLYRIVS